MISAKLKNMNKRLYSFLNKNISYSFLIAKTINDGIGFDNSIPWKLPTDLKFLKFITTNIEENSEISNSLFKEKHILSNILNLENSDIIGKNEEISKKINAVIMGRKTYDSLPDSMRPLKNRINIILTRDKDYIEKISSLQNDNVKAFLTSQCSIKYLSNLQALNEVFILGGSQIYNEFMENNELKKNLKMIYLTNIYNEFPCDTFLKLKTDDFKSLYISKTLKENDITFDFRYLVNKNYLANNPLSNIVNYKALTLFPQHEEYQYINLIRKIIAGGNQKHDRTNTGTKSLFGETMRFDLSNSFPLLTTKDVYWKGVVEELLWFIKGCTNVKVLQEKKVKIWDGNSTREFLDSIGLKSREEGDLGPIYGFQWRHFGAEYVNMHEDYTGKGVDQLKEVIDSIKNNPDSRRIIMCAWNPKDLKSMALPPCHVLCQFYVYKGKVSLQMYQRSCDIGLGVPFNIASYSLLLHMICHITNTTPGEFIHILGDAHVYNNHIEALKEQIQREPYAFPQLKINRKVENIEDFTYKDFTLIGYKHHPKIKMEMAV